MVKKKEFKKRSSLEILLNPQCASILKQSSVGSSHLALFKLEKYISRTASQGHQKENYYWNELTKQLKQTQALLRFPEGTLRLYIQQMSHLSLQTKSFGYIIFWTIMKNKAEHKAYEPHTV